MSSFYSLTSVGAGEKWARVACKLLVISPRLRNQGGQLHVGRGEIFLS